MASGKAVETDERQRWVLRWKNASTALDEQRATELRQLTPADAWAAIEAVLTFPVSTPLPQKRREHSGLVEMQQHFEKLRTL
jgi:hypothetical protein